MALIIRYSRHPLDRSDATNMKPVRPGWLSMPNWTRRMSGQGKSEMKLALKEIDTRIENYALFLSKHMSYPERGN